MLIEHNKDNMRIDDMLGGRPINFVQHDSVVNKTKALHLQKQLRLKYAHEKLSKLLQTNIKKSDGIGVSKMKLYDVRRYQAVHMYLKHLIAGDEKMKSSRSVANMLFNNTKSYMPRAIQRWTKTYLIDGRLASFAQGAHGKRVSLLDDADIKEKCLQWLRVTKPHNRSPKALKEKLETDIFSETLGVSTSVCLTTVTRYMNLWGFSLRSSGQQVYFDGHEREDVVAYRNAWAARMVEFRNYITEWEGDDMSIEIPPLNALVNQGYMKRVVLVTHDECTFYSNDGVNKFWLQKNESVMKKKGQGASIMVSDFLCACHGSLKLTPEQADELKLPQYARTIIIPGKNKDGWWKSEDMVKQLTDKAIPIFEYLHPGCTGLFMFDQSTNHNAYRLDALVASRMTLKPKIEKTYCFKDGYYFKDNTKISQSMFEDREGVRTFKGIKTVNIYFPRFRLNLKSFCHSLFLNLIVLQYLDSHGTGLVERKSSIQM